MGQSAFVVGWIVVMDVFRFVMTERQRELMSKTTLIRLVRTDILKILEHSCVGITTDQFE